MDKKPDKIVKDNNDNDIVDLNFDILYARYSDRDDDWHSKSHVHPYTELFYCVKGKGKFVAEDKTYIVKEDDLLIINSNISHTEVSIDDEEFAYVVVGIEGIHIVPYNSLKFSEMRADTNYLDYSKSFIYKDNFKDNNEEIKNLLKLILREMEEEDILFHDFANTYLELLILTIVRKRRDHLLVGNKSKENSQLEYVKKYIDQHYSRDISLDNLGEMAYINKYYLVHEFKKEYETTPIEYLVNKRIEVSKELLTTTDYSMEEIASVVGFNSQSYFNQTFKKKTNMTPSQYKKKNKKEFDN